ncbi:hypothetical protein Sste5346_009139 [Sporothrix stenoceras]|uniref:FAD dependent oxidoreductase domain-containing protein n=1 Tax=Sporothrix stenoceras TaxID=5173 RepID=A0ABR3YL65_9PEZI
MADKDDRVLIVGGGAWGLSTALFLVEAGYTNVTILERANSIPSPYSAAYDLNKIVRAEYEDAFYTELALKAIQAWKTPLFAPHYHQTGYIVATSGSAPDKAIATLEKSLASVEKHPVFAPGIQRLDGPDAFRKHAWQLSGPLTGFRGYINPLGGYAHSANCLQAVWEHVSACGVRSILGNKAGCAVRLEYAEDAGQVKVTGVVTADGKTHPAHLVICALGAHGAALVPQLGANNANVARCWSVAHVQLTESECNLLRGLPTTNVRDLGFFFEPDPKTRLFKLCPLGAGYTNYDSRVNGVSLPPDNKRGFQPNAIPKADELKLRRLLQETFPWMAGRPFVDTKLCWFSDTADSNYCIDFVPNTNRSVVALSGDSGHGFKMMPIFGQWVVDLLTRGQQTEPRWQWRAHSKDCAQWGDSVSWRVGEAAEWKDILEEQEEAGVGRSKL